MGFEKAQIEICLKGQSEVQEKLDKIISFEALSRLIQIGKTDLN